jgi:hypothetical protein
MHMQYEPRKADIVIPVQESEQAIPVKECMNTHYNIQEIAVKESAHAIPVKESAYAMPVKESAPAVPVKESVTSQY